MTAKVTLYGHTACPNVPPVRGMLAQSKVDYEYINIRKHPEAALRVREINMGYESVPTLVFPDGSTLTEPSASQLKAKIESLGYRVGPSAWLAGNLWLVLIGVLVLLAVLMAITVYRL
jgi:mycoredoxin